MSIKLIATDLDMTYLKYGQTFPNNVAAVQAAKQRGIEVVACTGRCWAMFDMVAKELNMGRYAITCSGGCINEVSSGKIIEHVLIRREQLEIVAKAAVENRDCTVSFFCGPKIFGLKGHSIRGVEVAPGEDIGGLGMLNSEVFDSFEEWIEAAASCTECIRIEMNDRTAAIPQDIVDAV